ncbi:DNA polymerase III subunit delta' [Fictibacillus macauensis ZFHKF-1]|uniref:DNA polymerase III subunit delta' n=1 Tax=Fictibacillus macauensis ZFHKF-1 TaxID=1196324 RepID=I8IXI9_9BACL|nr:DNA polymerase III subunit delta' [Fictibacillus macauensis]EIT84206.1 DNA polymerase III subunit delta' [Fictibacillus macauensis ZFHKF-1]
MSWEPLRQRQDKVVKTLTNSIKKNRLAHAYVFEGGRGTGKMEIALQVAKTYLCRVTQDANPCGECKDCRRIDSQNHPDVHRVAPDGQSIKIDQIRGLQKEFAYHGMESDKKVYIIEHVDRMTVQAANSLLKFLEEPSDATIALLLTEQKHRLLDTILSRAQLLTFTPLPTAALIASLQEEGVSSHMASLAAALTNDRSEALEICREEWFAQARDKVIQLTEELRNRPNQVLVSLQENWLSFFKEKEQLDYALNLLLIWYKDLLFIQLSEPEHLVFADQMQALEQQALHISQKVISEKMRAVLTAKQRLGANVNPQLLMEQLVLRLREG